MKILKWFKLYTANYVNDLIYQNNHLTAVSKELHDGNIELRRQLHDYCIKEKEVSDLTAEVLKLKEQVKDLEELNNKQTTKLIKLTEKLKDLKHTAKHRLLEFLKYDLDITITNEDID